MSVSRSFQIGSSIPVIRMLDEKSTLSFYLDFLGYELDWEHRFHDTPDSCLYAQIRLGQSLIHLNGHANTDSPVCEVRIPVLELESYHQFLCSKETSFPKPELVDPRYEGKKTDMNIVDPSGNLLVFWLRESI